MAEKEIKYFVAGYSEFFGSKQEALNHSKRLGLNDNLVSMILPRELTESMIRSATSQNLEGGDIFMENKAPEKTEVISKTRKIIFEQLERAETRAKDATSTEEFLRISAEITSIATILLSKNFN
ncbi:hypothetical protein HB904_16835 [Listeria booriae]|uniref:Uncharacterized protein n=1 Tax=Listeria booriae TaxID=1552123 RepID=A0A841YPQ7_9LIST|nr:hypothetical protein [Listeria booriae]MBC1402113.1 hypothetical protein [Listeria booriae]MBC1617845.1 hypothetical protein [Listeria booriae]